MEWQPIETHPKNKEIWVAYESKYNKKLYCVLALYAEEGQIEVNDDDGNFDTYNEATGVSTLPEGWYREAVCSNGMYDNLYVGLGELPLYWQDKPNPPAHHQP